MESGVLMYRAITNSTTTEEEPRRKVILDAKEHQKEIYNMND